MIRKRIPRILGSRRRLRGCRDDSDGDGDVAHASTAAYDFEMRSGSMLACYGVANLTLSLVIAGLAAHCQSKTRLASAAMPPRRKTPFFSADQVARSGRSSGRDDGLGHRVDAPFLDPVAGDQRHADRLQFRPFDLAAGIGIGAARMERAA